MDAKCFADAKIMIYVQAADQRKSFRALEIYESKPVVSAQVILEVIDSLTGEFEMPLADAQDIARSIMRKCEVAPITKQTLRRAIKLSMRYKLGHRDSITVAAALQANCEILYTEDLQHGLVFEYELRVVNPFVNRSIN